MRGEQIARQRTAWRAVPEAGPADLSGIAAVVLVKDGSDRLLRMVSARGGPVVYDALDFWPQPKRRRKRRSAAQRLTNAEDARSLFRPHFARIAPRLILCPTRAMHDDLAPLGWPVAVHHHHFDPRLEPGPGGARRTVLYHGHWAYLREWQWAGRLCRWRREACFVSSDRVPPPPAEAMLAVRGGRHGSWIARRWKSNVKAATAMRLGLPFVAWPEAAYLETAPHAHFFTTIRELHAALAAALEGPRPAPEPYLYSAGWSASRLEDLLDRHLAGNAVFEPGRCGAAAGAS